jgi:hypothetical protein
MAIRKRLNRDIESTNDTALNLSRRNFCVTAFASAIGNFTLAQGPARAAIVRTDDSSLPPYLSAWAAFSALLSAAMTL